MPSSPEFAAHCVELLSPLGPARAKRMFGGHGFYVDDVFVGIAISDRFYLKVDETSLARFEAAGCEPFVYESKDGPRELRFWWTAPDDALESPMLMLPWARMAMEASLKARNAKAPKRAATKKTGARKTPAAKASTKKQATKASVAAKTMVSPAPAPATAKTAAAKKTKKTPARKR